MKKDKNNRFQDLRFVFKGQPIKMAFFILVFFFLCNINIYSCTTPVYEYVRDKHYPFTYELVYYHDKTKLDEAIIQKHKKLRDSFTNVNIYLREVNVLKIKGKKDKYQKDRYLYKNMKKRKLPYYALFNEKYYYNILEDINDLDHFIRSPLREKIIEKLDKPIMCVVLLLESGDKEKDKKALKVIKEFISDSQLEDSVSLFQLSRDIKKEKFFIKMLLKVEEDLAQLNEPMAFPIFGRFRILEPLAGDEIIFENLSYLIQFLNADCSCVIKYNLPGVDMLHINDWSEYYE